MNRDELDGAQLDDERGDDLAVECERCGVPLGGWIYALQYCQDQDWYPVDPVCQPCKEEMLAMFGSHYLRWTRHRRADWLPLRVRREDP